jgi:hypothetical protein
MGRNQRFSVAQEVPEFLVSRAFRHLVWGLKFSARALCGSESYFAAGSFTSTPESLFNRAVRSRSMSETDTWLCVFPLVK